MQDRVSSAEFAEYMALYQMESRGSHYDDLRAGAIVSMLANIHRDSNVRKNPFGTLEFIPWNEHHKQEEEAAPILLADPEAQSNLIIATMFPQLHGQKPHR